MADEHRFRVRVAASSYWIIPNSQRTVTTSSGKQDLTDKFAHTCVIQVSSRLFVNTVSCSRILLDTGTPLPVMVCDFIADPTSQEPGTISLFLRMTLPSLSPLQGVLLIQTAPRPSHAARRSASISMDHRTTPIPSRLAIPQLLTAERMGTAMCRILNMMATGTAGKIVDDLSNRSTGFLTHHSGAWVSTSSRDTTPLGTLATRVSALLSVSP